MKLLLQITWRLGLLSMLLGFTNLIEAQTAVDDFLMSEEFKDFSNPRRLEKPKRGNSMEGRIIESEYLSLFSSGKAGGRKLIEWLGNSSSDFRRSTISGSNASQFIKGEVNFQIISTEKIPPVKVTTLLPKPKAYASQSYLILKDFAERLPPKLKFDSSEAVAGRFGEGKIYFESSGQCSLLINLNKGGLLHIGPANCDLNNKLVSLANSMDVPRLNRKLAD